MPRQCPNSAPCIHQAIGLRALSGSWCPDSIREFNWLEGYYAQFLLDRAVQERRRFPNELFVNDFGEGGLLMIGEGKGYGVVDATLVSNVRWACQGAAGPTAALCAATEAALEKRQARHQLQVWVDADRGRQLAPPT